MNGIGTGRGIARGEVQGERWAGDLPGQVAASLRSERGDGGPARQELLIMEEWVSAKLSEQGSIVSLELSRE